MTSTTRTKASSAQLAHLIEHMKVHKELALGHSRGHQERADLERQWLQLALTLNALGGPVKDVAKWKQTWRDIRNSIKKKAHKIKKEFKGEEPGDMSNTQSHINDNVSQDDAEISITDPVGIYGKEEAPCPQPADDTAPGSATPIVTETESESEEETVPLTSATLRLASVMEAGCSPSSGQASATANRTARKKHKRRASTRAEKLNSQLFATFEKQLIIEEKKANALERIAAALEIISKK